MRALVAQYLGNPRKLREVIERITAINRALLEQGPSTPRMDSSPMARGRSEAVPNERPTDLEAGRGAVLELRTLMVSMLLDALKEGESDASGVEDPEDPPGPAGLCLRPTVLSRSG